MDSSVITPKIKNWLKVIAALAFGAMWITLYLTYMHFRPEASDVCDLGEHFNCDIVNKSPWSVIDLGYTQVPVSLLGFLAYVILFIGSLGLVKNFKFTKIHDILTPEKVIRLMGYLTFIGVFFSLYLTYIEAFKLYTFCIFCLSQQGIILTIMGLFVAIEVLLKKGTNMTQANGGGPAGN